MSDSDNPSSKERVEEISVTEVSDQVLQELSGLFGGREPDEVTIVDKVVELSDTTVTDIVDLADVVDKDDTPQDNVSLEIENVIIIDRDVVEVLRSDPIDPLLNGMPEDAGTLVVIDDDLDGPGEIARHRR